MNLYSQQKVLTVGASGAVAGLVVPEPRSQNIHVRGFQPYALLLVPLRYKGGSCGDSTRRLQEGELDSSRAIHDTVLIQCFGGPA